MNTKQWDDRYMDYTKHDDNGRWNGSMIEHFKNTTL